MGTEETFNTSRKSGNNSSVPGESLDGKLLSAVVFATVLFCTAASVAATIKLVPPGYSSSNGVAFASVATFVLG